MKRLIYIILVCTCVFSQQRSVIFNTGNPAYTCSNSGGTYSNYTCDDECDILTQDNCIILPEGYLVDQNNTLANKFSVNQNYALEAFGVYMLLHEDSGDPALDHTATIELHADNNNSPGEVIGEWSIDVSTGHYHSLYVGDGCIDLDNGSSYWISAHVNNSYTQLIWLYPQASFYTFS